MENNSNSSISINLREGSIIISGPECFVEKNMQATFEFVENIFRLFPQYHLLLLFLSPLPAHLQMNTPLNQGPWIVKLYLLQGMISILVLAFIILIPMMEQFLS